MIVWAEYVLYAGLAMILGGVDITVLALTVLFIHEIVSQ